MARFARPLLTCAWIYIICVSSAWKVTVACMVHLEIINNGSKARYAIHHNNVVSD